VFFCTPHVNEFVIPVSTSRCWLLHLYISHDHFLFVSLPIRDGVYTKKIEIDGVTLLQASLPIIFIISFLCLEFVDKPRQIRRT
jgi:hypothetical protein